MRFLFVCIAVVFTCAAIAQDTVKTYPTHWWVGMKNTKLQLIIHARNVSAGTPKVTISYPGISVVSTKKFANPDYLALDLNIGNTARAGVCKISIGNTVAGSRYTINYQLKTKNPQNG